MKAGVAVYYPKYSKIAPFVFLGGQLIRRSYLDPEVEENSKTKDYGGAIFGLGLSLGISVTLDPFLTVSPVWNDEERKFNLLWGAGLHSTIFGIGGIDFTCESLKSGVICGFGYGLMWTFHNNPYVP